MSILCHSGVYSFIQLFITHFAVQLFTMLVAENSINMGLPGLKV